MLYELLKPLLNTSIQQRYFFILNKKHIKEEQEDLEMSEKTRRKDEIVIINKFKENGAENVTTVLAKVFEIFCNMQMAKR